MSAAGAAIRCPHCQKAFHSTSWLFSQDVAKERDRHALVCEDNPANRCFCGRVFSGVAARDAHAATCERNPANRYTCSYCDADFVTGYNVMGFKCTDGRALRDSHAVSCRRNPNNKCFCGQLFANADARKAHSETCEMNPKNRFPCEFCGAVFVTTFAGLFGFRGSNGQDLRDAHQLACEKNPRNACFCGRLFSSPDARDRHAALCGENPVNRFSCLHCGETFVTRYGMMGLVSSDGKSTRNTHQLGCGKNPANRCFCGQIFRNPDARDAHAAKCEMNPANRFPCPYCGVAFITRFGMFTKCGSLERSAHMLVCNENPSTATCEHCGATFSDAEGVHTVGVGAALRYVSGDAPRRCRIHTAQCALNPRNRYRCVNCDCCFVSGRDRWLRKVNGRALRDAHQETCDSIPCTFEVANTEFDDWLLLGDLSQEESGPSDPAQILQPRLRGKLPMCEACEVPPSPRTASALSPAPVATDLLAAKSLPSTAQLARKVAATETDARPDIDAYEEYNEDGEDEGDADQEVLEEEEACVDEEEEDTEEEDAAGEIIDVLTLSAKGSEATVTEECESERGGLAAESKEDDAVWFQDAESSDGDSDSYFAVDSRAQSCLKESAKSASTSTSLGNSTANEADLLCQLCETDLLQMPSDDFASDSTAASPCRRKDALAA